MADPTVEIIRSTPILLPAVWMTLGVADNLRHPNINRDDVARMLRLESLADWPEVMARVAYRRLADPTVARRLFRVIEACELVEALLLWVAFAGLASSLAGAWTADEPLGLARLALVAFTAVWADFLIGGKWLCYWYGSFGQPTHFLTLIWGIAMPSVVMP